MKIEPLIPELVVDAHRFCEEYVSRNYIPLEDLHKLAGPEGRGVTFVLLDAQGKVRGIRLTYPPQLWLYQFDDKKLLVRDTDSGVDIHRVGYFKAAVLEPGLTGQGWGPQLSRASLDALKKQGVQAVVTHSSTRSKGDASKKYLDGLGFKPLGELPLYWNHLKDVFCHMCSEKPCVCDAIEMILWLE